MSIEIPDSIQIKRDPHDPLCIAPFVGLYRTAIKTGPCCEWLPVVAESTEAFWNSDDMKKMRLGFMNHDKSLLPERCIICLDDPTSHSDSFYIGSRPEFKANYYKYKHTVDETGYMSSMPITYLAIGTSNKCNYACRICNEEVSSTKYTQTAKLGIPDNGYQNTYGTKAELVMEDWEDTLKKHGKTITIITVHGGDPTQHENMPEFLEGVHKYCDPNVHLHFLTNGSHRKCIDGESIWTKLNRFSNLQINFSMDAMKEINEYTRMKCNHDRLVKLILEAKEQIPHAHICIHVTWSNMTALDAPAMLDYLQYEMFPKGIHSSFNCVTDPFIYKPSNLPDEQKIKLMRELAPRSYAKPAIEIARKDLLKTLIEPFDPVLWQAFLRRQHILDQDSPKKIFEVFPEFKKYEEIKVIQ